MASFRVAFVQGAPRFGRTEQNLERGLALAASVEADLVVIPELWSSGYVFSSHAEVDALAEDAARGPTARALTAAAKRERRHIVAGFPERHRGHFYNSALLVGPGGVITVYRKLHLFENEQKWFEPGNLPLAVQRVGPARVGLLICFDWRFRTSLESRVSERPGRDAHPCDREPRLHRDRQPHRRRESSGRPRAVHRPQPDRGSGRRDRRPRRQARDLRARRRRRPGEGA
jgi:hypothetical protein